MDILYGRRYNVLYEDIILNKDLTPSIPDWLVVRDKPGKVEKIDDYTVRFVFEEPYGIFLEFLAMGGILFDQNII